MNVYWLYYISRNLNFTEIFNTESNKKQSSSPEMCVPYYISAYTE